MKAIFPILMYFASLHWFLCNAVYDGDDASKIGHNHDVHRRLKENKNKPSPKPPRTPPPTKAPSSMPSSTPTLHPSYSPSNYPTGSPTLIPSLEPSQEPTATLTMNPTATLTMNPTATITMEPATSRPTTQKPITSFSKTEQTSSSPTTEKNDLYSSAPTMQPTVQIQLGTFSLQFSMQSERRNLEQGLNYQELESVTEVHLSAFFYSQAQLSKSFRAVSLTVQSPNIRSRRRLQEDLVDVSFECMTTFLEEGAPSEETLQDLTKQAFQGDEWNGSYLRLLQESSVASAGVASVFFAETAFVSTDNGNQNAQIVDDNQGNTNSGKGSPVGGIIGGVVSALVVVALIVFGFVYRRKRKDSEKHTKHMTELNVFDDDYISSEVSNDSRRKKRFSTSRFKAKAGISKTLTIETDSTVGRSSSGPLSPGESLYSPSAMTTGSSRKSPAEDMDNYSLDGESVLGQAPNLGESMLGKVMALSNYSPETGADFVWNDDDPKKTKMVVHRAPSTSESSMEDDNCRREEIVNDADSSVFSFSNLANGDSESVMGSVLASINLADLTKSNVNESNIAHGSLTIADRQAVRRSMYAMKTNEENIPLATPNSASDGESSTDGIEIMIDSDILYPSLDRKLKGTNDVCQPEKPQEKQHVQQITSEKSKEKSLSNHDADGKNKSQSVTLSSAGLLSQGKSQRGITMQPSREERDSHAVVGTDPELMLEQSHEQKKQPRITVTKSLKDNSYPIQSASCPTNERNSIPKATSFNSLGEDYSAYSSQNEDSDSGVSYLSESSTEASKGESIVLQFYGRKNSKKDTVIIPADNGILNSKNANESNINVQNTTIPQNDGLTESVSRNRQSVSRDRQRISVSKDRRSARIPASSKQDPISNNRGRMNVSNNQFRKGDAVPPTIRAASARRNRLSMNARNGTVENQAEEEENLPQTFVGANLRKARLSNSSQPKGEMTRTATELRRARLAQQNSGARRVPQGYENDR